MGSFFLNKLKKFVLSLTFIGLVISATVTITPKPANAAICCVGCCSCLSTLIPEDLSQWIQNWININMHIYLELLLHQMMWFDWEYWQMYVLPAFMMMGEQLSAVGTQQMMIIGTFLDAKEAMETQRDLQVLHAKAHKDYHPSLEMCEFGTRVKTMAATERKGEMTKTIMSERFIDRMTSNSGGVSSGNSGDDSNRLKQYIENYCNVYDFGNKNDMFCSGHINPTTMTTAQRNRLNKDIDYVKTIYRPWTLDVDFTNAAASADKEDVTAMAANLYGYEGFIGVDPQALANSPRNTPNSLQRAYLDMRAVIAKESVAESSFNSLVALKSAGTAGSQTFLRNYLEQLGIPSAEAQELIGANPSYYAQMEILTKKAYQGSAFYTNLYDTPANVERKGVAMQAIGLMQKFDLLKSNLRTEASLSVLLELAVASMQDELEDAVKGKFEEAE